MPDMSDARRTPFHNRHTIAGGKIVDFAGWEMPIQYPTGIIGEHLATRKTAGLFNVSHMGRFVVRGADALPFLQRVLTNNAAALDVGQAQYTIIPNDEGGAIDDAYLYRFLEDEYILVVNASNQTKDWEHFQVEAAAFTDLELTDVGSDIAMLALQGPDSRHILAAILEKGRLPEPIRNELGIVKAAGSEVWVARTGYTGEPLCFELFVPAAAGPLLWDALVAGGATPVGLGARDTLRAYPIRPLPEPLAGLHRGPS